MKNIHILLLSCIFCIGLLGSCENDNFLYQDTARARLEGMTKWTLGTNSDSLSFNFLYAGMATEYEMEMTVRVMGKATNYDRKVNLSVVTAKTTAGSHQYTFPSSVTIPANEYKSSFPVVLKRTDDLANKTVSLCFEITASDDFQAGVEENSSLSIRWNDKISKPNDWDKSLAEFFGTYSDAKYLFIIDITGISDFSNLSWSEKWSMQITLITALQEYEKQNGQLLDEDGNPVNFPN